MHLDIKVDDLSSKQMQQFLNEHLEDMQRVSPPESKHALDLTALRKADVIVWSVWDKGILAGCGALKELDSYHAEIKFMRTHLAYRGRKVASTLLIHIIEYATHKHYKRLSLETGSMAFFRPARRLYKTFGFAECGPFADYKDDPNSVFMTKALKSEIPHGFI